MTQKQQSLIDELINFLPEEEKIVFEQMVGYLDELGYIPQKQSVKNFTLSFKHKINGKIIAKMGAYKQKGVMRVKFFACTSVPEKYINALRAEMDQNNYPNSMPISPPECDSVTSNRIMRKCTLMCNICTGGCQRYYYKYPDGKEIYRCGAYPVLIPGIQEIDIEEMKRLILEQHHYFLSIA